MRKYTTNCFYCNKLYNGWICQRSPNKDFCSKICWKRWCAKNCGEDVECLHCKKTFRKRASQIKKSPNHFCGSSCAASYNNTHKSRGIRRSKLEIWLEQELTALYPNLEIHYARKDTINSELDIYIPSLKLAFELNGIFHYEPIYGEEKLKSIQNNDNRKFQACLEKGIELVILDVSNLEYFKPKAAQKYLDIIIKILDMKIRAL